MRRDLQLLSAVLVAVTCVMLAAGTVVPPGPARWPATRIRPRYKLPLEGVTQLHADIGWLMAGLAVALVLGLRLSARRRGRSGPAGSCSRRWARRA